MTVRGDLERLNGVLAFVLRVYIKYVEQSEVPHVLFYKAFNNPIFGVGLLWPIQAKQPHLDQFFAK